jgi:UMP-CMP kinase
MQASDETMKKRILKRSETSGRSDDKEATIIKRIATFRATNQPIIDYYCKQGKVLTVSAFER